MYEELFYIKRTTTAMGNVMWWKPDARGYTMDLKEAGKYSYEEAKRICGQPNVEELAYQVSEVDKDVSAQTLLVDGDRMVSTPVRFGE